jgi:hypothetical protein
MGEQRGVEAVLIEIIPARYKNPADDGFAGFPF